MKYDKIVTIGTIRHSSPKWPILCRVGR